MKIISKSYHHAIIMIALILLPFLSLVTSACTSFLLEQDDNFYFVHSLNQGSWESVPGIVFINQRDILKHGYSWDVLVQQGDETYPSLVWKSLYGSVTFNPFGHEFPDGGMNEAGLFIWEMGFDPTQYPNEKFKPKLFQMQWMQYVLDNFTTIDQVINNAGQMSIDGWGWHYFVADYSGKAAIIDFIDGKPRVYSGDNLPIPLCCNSDYSMAMDFLAQHEGFGGELEISQKFDEIPRFIYGAKMLKEFSSQNPIDYGFKMLDDMSVNVRWSIVFDLSNMTVYFNTNLNRDIKHFTFSKSDFKIYESPLMLDIEHPTGGNVREKFIHYDKAKDIKLTKGVLKHLIEDSTEIDALAKSIVEKAHPLKDQLDLKIIGDWSGTIEYPSSDGPMEIPLTLEINKSGEKYTGIVNDNMVIKNLPLSNTNYSGGLLNFTVQFDGLGDLARFQLHTTGNSLKGVVETWDWENPKQALVNLNRK